MIRTKRHVSSTARYHYTRALIMVEITPPAGWTNEKEDLSYDYYWASKHCDGQLMAKWKSLTDPQPIMCSTGESGGCLYMFQSGTKYYIWNEVEGDVWKIVSPAKLEDILDEISQLGVGRLDVKCI